MKLFRSVLLVKVLSASQAFASILFSWLLLQRCWHSTSSIFTFYTWISFLVLSLVQDVLETQLNCYKLRTYFHYVLNSQWVHFSLSSQNIGYVVRVAWGHKIHVYLTQNWTAWQLQCCFFQTPVRRQMKAKQANVQSYGVTSSTARRILQSLEKMSSPLAVSGTPFNLLYSYTYET